MADAQQILHGMPERPVLDFLVRYFVAEVNWYAPKSVLLYGFLLAN